MTTYYKFLREDNYGPYTAFDYNPYLPKGGKPGAWLPTLPGGTRALTPCEYGYHFCTSEQMIDWLDDQLYEVEPGRATIDSGDKCVATRIRFLRHVETWNERTARLFAADCAERILPIYERAYPEGNAPRSAIEAARAYANGEIGVERLEHASNRVIASIRKAHNAGTTLEMTPTKYAAETAFAATLTEHAVRHTAKQAREAAIAYAISLSRANFNEAGQIWERRQKTGMEERAWQTARLGEYLRGEAEA